MSPELWWLWVKQNGSVTVELKVTSQRLLGKRVHVGEALGGLTLTVGLLRGGQTGGRGSRGTVHTYGDMPTLALPRWASADAPGGLCGFLSWLCWQSLCFLAPGYKCLWAN